MTNLTKLYCLVDDFVNALPAPSIPCLSEDTEKKKRHRKCKLSLSEMMTIFISFHDSGYRTFKGYYIDYVCVHLRKEFPHLISYTRFISRMPQLLIPLTLFMKAKQGKCTGIAFIDSTSIALCHNKRINRNKVFARTAKRGKTSMGWFFGFKLHLVVNEKGEILAFQLTKGNVDDRVPVPSLAKHLFGKLFADKGYLSNKLFQELWDKGTQLITTIKANMKQKLLPLWDRILLRKRFIIETINDQLKNISQIEHSRHRSPINCISNMIAALIAYQVKPNKPTLKLKNSHLKLLLTTLA